MFGFIFLIAEGITKYAPSTIPSDYNESFGRITTHMASITSYSQNTSEQTGLVGSQSGGITDFIGFFFGQGYKAVQIFTGALSLLNVFVDEMIENVIGDNPLGAIVKTSLITIILIVIVALLLHFVIKSDRI
jgi:hypothetical protein